MNAKQWKWKSHNLAIMKLTEWVIFFLLLGLTYFFIENAYREYLDGKTSFQIRQEPITESDHPTVTMCFDNEDEDLTCGHNPTISTMLYNENTLDDDEMEIQILTDGQNVVDYRNGVKRIVHLEKLVVHEDRSWATRQCFRINQKFDGSLHKGYGLLTDDGGYALGTILITFFDECESMVSETAVLYLTSEENSYGAVTKTWYDGLVKPMELKRGYFHNITITETRTYRHLPGTCMQKSFYQCLASRLERTEMCLEHGEPCMPFSMPESGSSVSLPPCDADVGIYMTSMTACYRDVFWALYYSPDCRGNEVLQGSCLETEYSAIERPDTSYEIEGDPIGFYFQYSFTPPVDSRRGRKIEPSKSVEEEYLVWDVYSLIGNVGGSMGILVGFSFLALIGGAIDILANIWKKTLKKQQLARRNGRKAKLGSKEEVTWAWP